MVSTDPFALLAGGHIFETLLPDLVLAFAFFSALSYAVLGKRLGQQRPAIAMSAAMGLALAVGLVWWEARTGWSIQHVGPIAMGFALVAIGSILFQAMRQIGGSWSGAAIALGVSLLIGLALGLDWPFDIRVVQSIAVLILIAGILVMLARHEHRHGGQSPVPADIPRVRHDMSDLLRDYRDADRVGGQLNRARARVQFIERRPDVAAEVSAYLERILPVAGELTERLANLRSRAQMMKAGHLAKLKETRHRIAKLPPDEREPISGELRARYQQLAIDDRLERLDGAVAETERRIRDVTGEARKALEAHDYRRVSSLLDMAGTLQKHNMKLIRHISSTESRLAKAIENVAKLAPEVKDA